MPHGVKLHLKTIKGFSVVKIVAMQPLIYTYSTTSDQTKDIKEISDYMG